MKKSLLALAMGGFGIGMTEFVIMGLLPDVATSLKISIPEAGHLISAYALGVVIGAPTLTGIMGKHPPKKILFFLITIFTLFNGLSSLAPNFSSLMLFRFLSGLPHGAFFGVGAVVASRLADTGKEASAVSIMFSGLTIANVVGVPLGTFIGHQWNWRVTFFLVALTGILTLVGVQRWIPTMTSDQNSSLLQDLKIFKRGNLWLSMALTSIGFGGFFAWISYIAPLLTQESGFSANLLPLLMSVAGLGMNLGNIVGGKLADRFSPLTAIVSLMLVLAVVLNMNGLLASSKFSIVLLTFLTGVIAMALCSPIQMLLILNSKDAEMLGASLGQASFNIGNALGAYLGGIPLTFGLAYTSPQWVGAGMCAIGATLGLILQRRTTPATSFNVQRVEN